MVEEQRETIIGNEVIIAQIQISKMDEFDIFSPHITEIMYPYYHRPATIQYKEDQLGYYNVAIGEIINERYKITGIAGKGVFGSVVKAADLELSKEVAIKIIRKGEIYQFSGEREASMLSAFNSSEPNGR